MLSPFGIIRIWCLHHILSENKADWSIFPGAVQFLISPKHNIFQSTQAASTCTISFYVFIPIKIIIVYLSSFMKFVYSSALKSRMKFKLNTQAIAQRSPLRIHVRYWYVLGKCSVCHFSNKSIKNFKLELTLIYCSLWNIDWSLVFNQPWPKPTANLVSFKFYSILYSIHVIFWNNVIYAT